MGLTADAARVFEFVGPRTGEQWSPGMTGLGLVIGVVVVAGVLYERWNGVNIWMHVAVDPAARGHPQARRFARAIFAYPFDQLGAQRITAWIEARNSDAVRLAYRCGFHHESRMQGAASDGGDVLLLVLRRSECRLLARCKHGMLT